MNYNFNLSETASINLYVTRIVAAHLVMLGHGIGIFLQHVLGLYLANLGLIFFFFISGLMTPYSVFRKKSTREYSFKEYLINRFSRIFPPLAVTLIILIIIDGFSFNNPLSYNILSFFATLFFLNDTCLGIPSFGSARPLWTLPLFWWSYMFFGWVYLRKKTVKSKYVYFIILGALVFICFLVFSGFQCNGLSRYIKFFFLWNSGLFIIIILNRIEEFNSNYRSKGSTTINSTSRTRITNHTINQITKSSKKNHYQSRNSLLSKSLIKLSAVVSLILFCLTLIVHAFYQNSYPISYLMLFICSFFFFLVYSQYSQHKYSQKTKRIIIFLSNYSFTLFLLHYSLYGFFIDYFRFFFNNIVLLLISYICINLISIGVAYISEMRSNQFNAFLLKKFKLSKI